ncbi:MAG: sulfatase [bacterium]|nr:sulfatase [bacterium]
MRDRTLPMALAVCLLSGGLSGAMRCAAQSPPNVLIAISDDQSYPHASAYGEPVIQTPGFDEVARRGVLFHNAFTPAPGCSPMRAAFLTGRYIWQIREAGTHASHFPRDLVTFPERLASAGYRVGYTGKPWGPGNFRISGWEQNPAGPAFNERRQEAPKGISATDYASNFEQFLDERDESQPFCFWFGGHEPHRSFDPGIGLRAGMDIDAVRVPAFLPDDPVVRSDMLDYFYEIQWFDQHLVRMLRTLEARGELENTLVIVTSDNGMSFPRAKANVYEYGIHMPLAVCWPEQIPGQRNSQALVNLIDLTATIYDACGIEKPESVTGSSLLRLLQGEAGDEPIATYSGRERHSSSRWNSLGYPQRCVRTADFLYIRNYTPERWPAGAPQTYAKVRYEASGEPGETVLGPEHGGYHDIDACPTLDFLVEMRGDPNLAQYLKLSVGLRPAEEFYEVRSDPSCLKNLVGDAKYLPQLQQHRQLLRDELVRTGDLREINFEASHVWETYPRYSSLRWFPKPDWALDDSVTIPRQDWLEDRRPR